MPTLDVHIKKLSARTCWKNSKWQKKGSVIEGVIKSEIPILYGVENSSYYLKRN